VKPAFLSIATFLVLAGCRNGELRLSKSDFQNDPKGDPKAIFNLPNGTKLPVTVVRNDAGDTIQLSINAQGEELEREEYRLTDSEFDLIRADSDVFTPPIQLVKFPSNPNDHFNWKGVAKEGSVERQASADIVNSQITMLLGGARERVQKVVVHLAIDSGTSVPAKRDLSFWFTEGKGLVKRDYGAGSGRSPVEESQ